MLLLLDRSLFVKFRLGQWLVCRTRFYGGQRAADSAPEAERLGTLFFVLDFLGLDVLELELLYFLICLRRLKALDRYLCFELCRACLN